MSNAIDNFYTLHNNVIVFTPIIVGFYKNYGGSDKDILLSYLVLPLVLQSDCRREINTSITRSHLSKIADNKKCIAGLPLRVDEYKEITNRCIQYALDNKIIEIDEKLCVKVIDSKRLKNTELTKTSGKLKNIFEKFDVVTIYKLLGLKKL